MIKVKDVMKQFDVTLKEEDSISGAVKKLIDLNVECIIITDQYNKIKNLVTKNDIIKFLYDFNLRDGKLSELPVKKDFIVSSEENIEKINRFNNDYFVVVDDNGKYMGILYSVEIDKHLTISKEKEIEKLNTVINTTSNGVILINMEGRIKYFNSAACGILRLNKGKLKNNHIDTIIPDIKYKNVIRDKKGIYKEKIQFGNMSFIYDCMPLYINGEFIEIVIIFQDASVLENVLCQLEINKEILKQLDSIIEFSYDGIYITDGEANTLRINKAYERITGLKRENMLGKNMKDLVQQGYISKSGSLLVLKERETVTITQEFSTGKKVLITSKPVFDENRNIILIITNVRDVTELYTLKEELENKEKLAEKYYFEIEQLKHQFLDTENLVVRDKSMLDVLNSARRASETDITILLLGESGVGKEEVAKFIHNNSNRKNKQFIKINCGAIPENLIESELFGYEKGAFTGAVKDGKIGLFEIADGGTLFLDEVGELPLNIQVKLLRVLQEGEITKIGGSKPILVDVRIISATNRNLEEMVKNNLFREDLFYRLNVIPITIPALRKRKQDIFPLINCFLGRVNEKYGWNKSISGSAFDVLYDYNWPGNVRELKNIIERIAVMSNSQLITCEDLPKQLFSDRGKDIDLSKDIIPLKEAVNKVEMNLINKAYNKYGNVRDAAKALGIDASTLVRKRKKFQ